MEANPVLPSSVEDTSSSDKRETRRRKKKNVENLGTFIVETKPSEEKQRAQAVKKAERYLRRLEDRDFKSEPAALEIADVSSKLAKENDKTPELDGEAPLEHLSHVETLAVNQNLGKVRQEEIVQEMASLSPGTSEALQAEVAHKFIDMVSETGDTELAIQKIAESYDLGEVEIPPPSVIIESEVEDVEEVSAEDGPEVIDTHQLNEGEIYLNPAEHTADSSVPPTTSAGPGSGGAGRGGFSGGIVPPSPGGSLPPLPPPSSPAPGSRARTPAAPDTVSYDDLHYYEKKAVQRGLIVGGIVGYLIGRRRGRIKTEKKLLPVQKKLRKEVQSLESRLIDNEYALRRAVSQRNELSRAQALAKRKAPTERAPKLPVGPEPRKAPEAEKPKAQKVPLERIGHVIVAAEAVASNKPVAAVEKSGSKPASSSVTTEKQASTMRRSELLELSEKISVEGTSLRQIYETHLISERALRRLVSEYLRGGSIQKALRRELIEREIDFERDPILRDRARSSVSGSGKGAVNSLVHESAAIVTTDKNTSTKAKLPKPKAKTETDHQTKGGTHLADVSLVAIIAILLALVIYIALRGH